MNKIFQKVKFKKMINIIYASKKYLIYEQKIFYLKCLKLQKKILR